MPKQNPPWFDETRAFCKTAGIKIMAWGPNLLTVEAKSPARAREIAVQLGNLGFHAIENEDNSYAGVLDLSKDPQALQAQLNSFDISHRRFEAKSQPLMWAAISAIGFTSAFSSSPDYHRWLDIICGVALAALFVCDALRLWTWRLELLPEGLHVRRYCRWAMIPWSQIRSIDSRDPRFSPRKGCVVTLTLESRPPEILGTFSSPFGINLRDRLRYELAQRRK